MAKAYLRTGRISWSPLTDSQKTMLATVANVGIGTTFSASLDSATEQFLIGNGVIAPTTAHRRTITCPFSFDSPGLANGFVVYTPIVGDILHDAWFEVDTPWDGTTPKGDIGSFVGGSLGWFGNNNVALNMAVPDVTFEIYDASLLTQHSNANFGQVSTLLSMAFMQAFKGGTPTIVDGWVRALPAKWVTADPVKAVVSQNGTPTGADPGSTQGAAVLYLDISTPQAA